MRSALERTFCGISLVAGRLHKLASSLAISSTERSLCTKETAGRRRDNASKFIRKKRAHVQPPHHKVTQPLPYTTHVHTQMHRTLEIVRWHVLAITVRACPPVHSPRNTCAFSDWRSVIASTCRLIVLRVRCLCVYR